MKISEKPMNKKRALVIGALALFLAVFGTSAVFTIRFLNHRTSEMNADRKEALAYESKIYPRRHLVVKQVMILSRLSVGPQDQVICADQNDPAFEASVVVDWSDGTPHLIPEY